MTDLIFTSYVNGVECRWEGEVRVFEDRKAGESFAARMGLHPVFSEADQEPVELKEKSRAPWAAACALLIVVAFAVGERTGDALAYHAEDHSGELSLQCGVDGHAELSVSGEQLDGDHVLEALRSAAGRICSRHGT